MPGMLLFIDFEKAFDSLEWNYLFKVLEVMNFGPMFGKWIHTFYSNITSCVMNNGYVSDFFQLYRGVRQGCPLSGLLFVLTIEVLAQVNRENENIRGLTINETELKLSMYADDLTAFIKDECSASHLFNLLHDFESARGSENKYLENGRNVAWNPKMQLRQTRPIPHCMARRICICARCRPRL